MFSNSSKLLERSQRAPYRFVDSISSKGFHTIAYRDWSCKLPEEKQKTTTICLHGLTRNSRDFDDIAKVMSKDRRVLCPDTAGRGHSDWLRSEEDYTLSQYNLDVSMIIAQADISSYDVVGTSLGGLMGIILAGMDRTKVRRLVINDIAPEIPMWALQRLSQYLGENPLFRTLNGVEEYMRKHYSQIKPMNDKQWRKIAKHSSMRTSEGYRLAYDPTISKNYRRYWLLMYFNIWEYWENIECPVLVLRGMESDFLSDDLVEKMQKTLPHVEFMNFEGVGHTPSLNAPEQIKPVVDWLNQ